MVAALSIRELRKTYKNGMEALKGISLDVEEGDFFALLGPNGAGKSTTLGIVSSLVNKNSGTVRIFDYDLDTQLAQAKMHLGVVPQEFNFNQFEKVYDILVTQAGFYGITARQASDTIERLLHELGLWDKRDVQARTLSGGMKRRLMIARALVHHPKLLILDEPTAGVDVELRRSMWKFMQDINRAGTTIILTTHYLEEAEALCRNIAIIDGGMILENTSKRDLLRKLHLETFLLDVREPLAEAPELTDVPTRLTQEGGLEVDIHTGQTLNQVFAELTRLGIEVTSMRAKSNRLEELFLSLTE